MARQQDWEIEARDAMRHEEWSLTGPSRVVKVLPAHGPTPEALQGFICLEKVLSGRTPLDIEFSLGVKRQSLRLGCRIFRFLRLPSINEVEYELTAFYPDGLAFNPGMHSEAYPPGRRWIHQWRLLVDVPVEQIASLRPGEFYKMGQ